MKKNLQDFAIITLCLLFLSFILMNNTIINNTVIESISLWVFKVFPSLFPMILINNILIDYNLPYYILKLLKRRGLKIYILLLSILSGSPNNAIIIKELYQKKYINEESANKALTYTFFSNPIFLVTMLSIIFSIKVTFYLILISYSSNFILSILIKTNLSQVVINKNHNHSISKDIIKTINVLLMILGTITLYILISTIIINIFKLSPINSLFIKGTLELTQGLNSLAKINLSILSKELIALFFINFGGFSIHSQIKSILEDTSLSYKYFLFGRLLSFIVAVFMVLHIV